MHPQGQIDNVLYLSKGSICTLPVHRNVGAGTGIYYLDYYGDGYLRFSKRILM